MLPGVSTAPKPQRREQQAAETRRLILEAARLLFVRQGFAATSMAQVAAEAGVAVPTVYASVGTKPRLLDLLAERIDEESTGSDLLERLLVSRKPREVLRMQCELSRRLNERAGDVLGLLRSAATSERATSAHTAVTERHRDTVRSTARRLGRLGALRAEIPPDRAAALLDLHLAPDAWTTLTRSHGLTWDEAAALMLASLERLLLRPKSIRKG